MNNMATAIARSEATKQSSGYVLGAPGLLRLRLAMTGIEVLRITSEDN